ncbi:hypothetical protein Afil01_65900 [Actinorhabdospora filicis]|uniref:DUF1023 domain-containing protein n=1 Tax=Actinorhabdospora filicis TaxID=1785913 RepID=A0A9W6SSZ6_9ACTN|nr:alpha/beta hydrolase [Actinorhabdospora filicis]GLZ81783.1 hypothetical protein Afil01_65900 [Actinorhabdospora filicis]
MVDYRQLKDARPAVWTEGGTKAASIGRDMDQYAEDVGKYGNDLDRAWQGNDAVAARHSIVEASRDYVQAQVAFTAMGEILGRLAHDVTEAQKMLNAAEDHAARVPAKIHPDGSVTADPPPEARKSDGWMASIRQGVEAVADEIKRALELANKADKDAAKALAAITTPEAPNVDPLTALQTRPEGHDGQPPTPDEVKKWWDGLSEEEQESLKNEYPGIVGNMDGIPTTDRDDANRVTLDYAREQNDRDIAGAKAELDRLRHEVGEGKLDPFDPRLDAARQKIEDLEAKKHGLDAIDARLNDGSKPQAHLLSLDPQNDGKAAVAIGNPDKADNVATYVPGTGGGLNDGFKTDIDRADQMQKDAAGRDPSKTTASIVWQGYDSPDELTDATDPKYRHQAADDLARFQQGLRTTNEHGPDHSRNTLLGHSYGASVVGTAAEKHDLKVDNLVQVAAPGSGQDHGTTAADYKGHPKVYASTGNLDVINLARGLHGADTVSHGYGANVFDGGYTGHTGYWNDDAYNESVSKIVTGTGGEVGNIPPEQFSKYRAPHR